VLGTPWPWRRQSGSPPACTHACSHTCMLAHIPARTHSCAHTSILALIRARTHPCSHSCTYSCSHTFMHEHIHAHIHARTHTRARATLLRGYTSVLAHILLHGTRYSLGTHVRTYTHTSGTLLGTGGHVLLRRRAPGAHSHAPLARSTCTLAHINV
jgi:hypothetical protein